MKNAILGGLIYAFKRGQVSAYTEDPKRYRYLIPADDWTESTNLGDAWICDREGNIDTGLNVSPVPVRRDVIGALVGRAKP